MAGEEDVELRDLVAQTLETKGVLGKIRAQLRASVFLALEEHESDQKPHPLASSKVQQFLKTKDGQVATALVREFLEFFELDYTCAVFDPESNALETYPGREKLAHDLGIDSQTSSTAPLLIDILQRSRHTPSPPSSSAIKQLKFPESETLISDRFIARETDRTTPIINSIHPLDVPSENRRVYDDPQLPPLQTGKLSHSRENDTTHQNSHSVQPVTNAAPLNTNENSNLRLSSLKTNSSIPDETVKHPQNMSKNGTRSDKPGGLDVSDISVGTLHAQGVHAELGETFANDSTLDMDKVLNSTEDLDKLANLGRVTTYTRADEARRDEFDDFFDTPFQSLEVKGEHRKGLKSEQTGSIPDAHLNGPTDPYVDHFHSEGKPGSHVSEELSNPLSSVATGKFETEDMTLSQHSLAGDFDYSELVQS